MTIAVTGATGRLGGRVAQRLAAGSAGVGSAGAGFTAAGSAAFGSAGEQLRLVVRDPARAPRLAGASVVQASFGDAAAVRAALDGVDTVLMVSAAESPDRVEQHRSFIDAAASASVGHIVYISFYGASPDATFTLARDHWATEQHLRDRGLTATVLRDNLYADFLPGLVGADGVIRGPAGDGRVAAVAQDDIADAAVAVLRDPAPHAGRTYSLTGPAALTLGEIAGLLGATYRAETIDEAYASRAGYGAPRWELDAWVSTYTAIAAGELAGVTGDVAELTGHPATGIPEVVRAIMSA